MRIWVKAALLIGLAPLAACVHHHHHAAPAPRAVRVHPPGPPPHAPAHGHRHKHDAHNVELVFDAGLGLYVVVGHLDHYFHRERFFRWDGKSWYASSTLGQGWVVIHIDTLPEGLRKAHRRAHKAGKKRRHDHHPPAKHDY